MFNNALHKRVIKDCQSQSFYQDEYKEMLFSFTSAYVEECWGELIEISGQETFYLYTDEDIYESIEKCHTEAIPNRQAGIDKLYDRYMYEFKLENFFDLTFDQMSNLSHIFYYLAGKKYNTYFAYEIDQDKLLSIIKILVIITDA